MYDLLASLFKDHPAIKVLAIWVFAAIVWSIRYHIELFEQFGINLFDFVTIKDLLLLSLRQFMLASTALLLSCTLMAAAVLRIRFGPNKSASIVDNIFLLIAFILIFLGPLFLIPRFAKNDARIAKGEIDRAVISTQANKQQVEVFLVDKGYYGRFGLIATTSDFIFLFSQKSRDVKILPREIISSFNVIGDE